MAKSKHSPALFEVVHGKKQLDKRARTGVLRTPNWWFKGRHRGTPTAPAFPDEAPAFVDEVHDPTAVATLPAPERDDERERERERGRDPEPEPRRDPTEPVLELSIPSRFLRSRAGSPLDIQVDKDRHEVFLRVRYTTAIVSGFALLVVVALAYVTGRHLARGPSEALAYQPTEDVAEGPIQANVLQVGRGAPPVATGAGPGAGLPAGANRPAASQRVGPIPAGPTTGTAQGFSPLSSQQPRPPGPAIEPKPGVVEGARRTIGLNYVVMQSYPETEKKLADEAVEYLNRSGIPCTIERGLPGGWNTKWYCVVGTTGFARVSGRDYETYLEAVDKVNKQFAGKSRFKRLEPTAIKWRLP